MRLYVLTSSRADYSIYLPLLKRLQADDRFDLQLIALGTHASVFHGSSLDRIRSDGFEVKQVIESLVLGDSSEAISSAIGLTTLKFSSFWAAEEGQVDLILCLGDRYEMYAAVLASLPFQIPVAHIHGGETTLGAIDNVFRHSLSLMSSWHFVSTEAYVDKIKMLIPESERVFHVGALALDNLGEIDLMAHDDFKETFGIDLTIPTILTTFHPETVSLEKNGSYARELAESINNLSDFQVVITMPNADTMGNEIRKVFQELITSSSHVIGVENFGTVGYFSIMKSCSFLLGNTSSGILEAASFGKYVINLGDRQKGRLCGENVFHCPVDAEAILTLSREIAAMGNYEGENIYWNGGAAAKIVEALIA